MPGCHARSHWFLSDVIYCFGEPIFVQRCLTSNTHVTHIELLYGILAIIYEIVWRLGVVFREVPASGITHRLRDYFSGEVPSEAALQIHFTLAHIVSDQVQF